LGLCLEPKDYGALPRTKIFFIVQLIYIDIKSFNIDNNIDILAIRLLNPYIDAIVINLYIPIM